jgi:hypothetical protein
MTSIYNDSRDASGSSDVKNRFVNLMLPTPTASGINK